MALDTTEAETPGESDTSKISRIFSTEFRDANQESAYRFATFKADALQTTTFVYFSIFAVLVFVVADGLFDIQSSTYSMLVLLRLGLVVFFVGILLILYRSKTPGRTYWSMFTFMGVISVGTVLIDYTRPPEYLGHISTDILTIFFFYFAVRSPLKMQFTIAISFTVAILTILFVHKQPPDSLYYFNIPVILALANLIGYLGARQHSVVRHTQFLENKQLLEAHDNVRTLSGLVPICSGCKKIRTDDGYWQQIEAFINERSELNFSHGICPDCKVDLYPELLDDK